MKTSTKNRFGVLLAAIAIMLMGLIASAPSAAAVTQCSQKVFLYDGLNATGNVFAACVQDYPLATSPEGTGYRFDNAWFFQGTSILVDNKISSYQFWSATQNGYAFRLYAGYALSGTHYDFVKVSGNPVVNLPAAINNAASSYAGCGTSCSDEPN